MSDQQEATTAPPPPAKRYRYRQDQIPSTEQLYLEGKYPDVHFSFRSNDGTVTRVPAHKSLLAASSDVFARMFYGELKETGDVTITDASEAAFKEFLQFFYMNEVDLTAEHVATVMDLGNKYNVKNCIGKCVQLLNDDLTNGNVCNTLSLAILYDHEELIKTCEKHILVNTENVFKTAAFWECSKEVLAHILDMKLLSCSEVAVFEACMAWVRAKSKQNIVSKAMVKKHLGDLYYEIRFASMTMREFCEISAEYRHILSNDFEAITRLIVQPETESQLFNTLPRHVNWNEDAVIECNRDNNSENHWYALNAEEKIIFSTNKPLFLGKFQCNEITFDKCYDKSISNLLVNVEVTEARTSDGTNAIVLANMIAKLETNYVTVSFTHPILIRPDFFYTIRFKGFPKDCCFESGELRDCITLDDAIDIDIEFHNDRIEAEKIVGLIWNLWFNQI